MHGRAAIYVPAEGAPARFLARVGAGGPPELRLRLTIEDRLINEVTLSHAWREIVVAVPRTGRQAYRRVELQTVGTDGAPSDVAVGIGIVRFEP